jgi:hypothetical protein
MLIISSFIAVSPSAYGTGSRNGWAWSIFNLPIGRVAIVRIGGS